MTMPREWTAWETLSMLLTCFVLAMVAAVFSCTPAYAWDNSPAFTHQFQEPSTYASGEPLTTLASCTLLATTTGGQYAARTWPATAPSGGGIRRWTWSATLGGTTPTGCGRAEIYCWTTTTRSASAVMEFAFAGCETAPPPDPGPEPVPIPDPNTPPPPPAPCAACPCPDPPACDSCCAPPPACPTMTPAEIELRLIIEGLHRWVLEHGGVP